MLKAKQDNLSKGIMNPQRNKCRNRATSKGAAVQVNDGVFWDVTEKWSQNVLMQNRQTGLQID